jgi:hypothetical protein
MGSGLTFSNSIHNYLKSIPKSGAHHNCELRSHSLIDGGKIWHGPRKKHSLNSTFHQSINIHFSKPIDMLVGSLTKGSYQD